MVCTMQFIDLRYEHWYLFFCKNKKVVLVVEKRISYVEDECRTDENCVTNAICNATTQICKCDDDFIGTNGLCCM